MFVPWVLLICVTFALSEKREATYTNGETAGLGKVVNLPKINLLADFQEQQNSIFDTLPSECFIKKALKSSSSKFEYYASTKALYKSLATQSSLSASLTSAYSLGVTVSVATKSKSSEETELSGMSLIKQALTEKIHVDKECLVSSQTSTLKKEFLEDIEELPEKIEKPWQSNYWTEYRTFLRKYGSHVITSVKRGSRFQQMTFAESSKSYTERDFQVKACVSAAGTTSVGKLGVSACSNVSQSEISKASRMSTSESRFVIGGQRETNSKLANGETSVELINQLMDEADDSSAPVQHTFMAIWSILQSRFKTGSPNYIRAINLEYYYSGFLNYDCPYKTRHQLELQKFDYTRGSDPKHPEFECSLAKEGCHSDDDCHYVVGVWCTCRGETCVRYKSVKQETGDPKKMACISNDKNWDWKGCDWKIWASKCGCYNKNRDERKVVWSLPNRAKDAGKHQAPNNGTQHNAKGPAQYQVKGEVVWPLTNTANEAAKHQAPGNGKYHKAKDPVQYQVKGEEIEM